MLTDLVDHLRQSIGIIHKQDIQQAANYLGQTVQVAESDILMGDDCAAIPHGNGYLLLAAEGMWPLLVETEPWFAGWCSIMVNVSDVYAMGGHPLAVVDVIWSQGLLHSAEVWSGMKAAAETYQVPIIGGHTNVQSRYNALAVAILGQADHLIASSTATPGDCLLMVVDPQGHRHLKYPFWNAATDANPADLRRKLKLLPQLAAEGLCTSGKDISMGGIIGTTLMLLETSGCGAHLYLDQIWCPASFDLADWLCCFPSYGFLLSVDPKDVPEIQNRFQLHGLECRNMGTVNSTHHLVLHAQAESALFWDLQAQHLTGFSRHG